MLLNELIDGPLARRPKKVNKPNGASKEIDPQKTDTYSGTQAIKQ